VSSLSAKEANKNIYVTDFVSQNVRGLKSNDRMDERFNAITSRIIFAACIQEAWRTGCDALEYEDSFVLLAGLDPENVTCNRRSQGVRIVLSASAVKAWRAAGSIVHNDLGARVIAVCLLTKECLGMDISIFLISAYAPIGASDESIWNEFFDSLNNCLS